MITVLLCCNSPHGGLFLGQVEAVQVGDQLLTLEGPALPLQFMPSHIKVNGHAFPATLHHEWVGNWCWDSVQMKPEHVAALVNFLRGQQYTCIEARSDLYQLWEKAPRPFMSKDLVANPPG